MVEITYKKGIITRSGSPEKEINDAFNGGYYREAFSRLDAEIDEQLEHMLRMVYNENNQQDVINAFILATKRKGFAHFCKEILVKKKIISGKLNQEINDFRQVRDIVLHNVFPVNDILMKKYGSWWEKIQSTGQLHNTIKNSLGNDLRLGLGAWRGLISATHAFEKKKVV